MNEPSKYAPQYLKVEDPAPEWVEQCRKLQGLRMSQTGERISIQDIYREVFRAGIRDLFDRKKILDKK